MVKLTAFQYSQHNIRINCVCPGEYLRLSNWQRIVVIRSPGIIDTPLTRPLMDFLEPMITNTVPMNRAGTTQEVADCVLFLCSSKASFVQGSAMIVDGGYLCT